MPLVQVNEPMELRKIVSDLHRALTVDREDFFFRLVAELAQWEDMPLPEIVTVLERARRALDLDGDWLSPLEDLWRLEKRSFSPDEPWAGGSIVARWPDFLERAARVRRRFGPSWGETQVSGNDDASAADDAEVAEHLLRELRVRSKRLLDPGIDPAEVQEFKRDLERVARLLRWDTPEVKAAIAEGRYRHPGFVLSAADAEGYDRDLAKRSVGAGWALLIDEVFDRRDREFPSVVIEQVKEKLAGLRIYFRSSSGDYPGFMALTEQIEARSERTCEKCGAPGVIRAAGWLKTWCDLHSEGRPPLTDRPLLRRPGPSDV